jgi:putative FmdB family regulatory protein
MPIYEYACTACHHEMEVIQKMADESLQQCPACQQPSLKKLISRSGFRLAGSGWYETDFKNKKKTEEKSNSDTDSKETATTPETTTPSAAAASPEKTCATTD